MQLRDCSVGLTNLLALVLYDRQGRPNTLLDILILALGLSPLTIQADTWNDKPSLKLWPLSLLQRIFVNIVRPLGVGCESHYTRIWDEASKSWIQNGVHRAYIMPGIQWEAKTSAIIDHRMGACSIKFEMFGGTWQVAHEGYKA